MVDIIMVENTTALLQHHRINFLVLGLFISHIMNIRIDLCSIKLINLGLYDKSRVNRSGGHNSVRSLFLFQPSHSKSACLLGACGHAVANTNIGIHYTLLSSLLTNVGTITRPCTSIHTHLRCIMRIISSTSTTACNIYE